MQKQRQIRTTIKYQNEKLDDTFPIRYYSYIQKNQDQYCLHYHTSFEIGICIRGSGLFFIGNEVFSFTENDVSFIFPNQPHIAQSPDEIPSEWYFIVLDFQRLFLDNSMNLDILLLNQSLIPNMLSHSKDRNIAMLISMLVTELKNQEQGYRYAVREILSIVIIKLLRLSNESNDLGIELSNSFVSISPALTFVSKNYSEDIVVNSLAKECNLSETHFRTLFKKATGLTPMQYIVNIRMRMAKTLLKSTKLSILVISQRVGFQSVSSFNRFFKKQFNITPSRYREQN